MSLSLRSQLDLLDDIEARLRDPSNYRWSQAEIYRALNDALHQWDGRVSVPAIYEPGATWPTSVSTVTLPAGIDPASVQVQVRELPVENVDIVLDQWFDMQGWRNEPTATFGNQVRSYFQPASEYRLLYWITNGPVPVTVPTLDSELSDTATSLTLTTTAAVGDNGFCALENEWVHYRGVQRGATTLTLQNLTRGLLTSTAATHAALTPVYWCVAAPRQDLYNQLLDQGRAYLHEMTLVAASPQSRDVHERMVSYYQARADAFWRRWMSVRAPRWKIELRDDGTL
jgi:hypothetical protein